MSQELTKDWPFSDYELPRLDRLSSNLVGASFFLMKLLPARYMLQKAVEEGFLTSGNQIIETTSGTFGLALAMLSTVKGYKLTLISDPVIDGSIYRRLEDLGVHVEIITQPDPKGGYQQARLNRLNMLLKQNPDAFWPDQYGNRNNPQSYAKVAEHLLKELGPIDFLVGPVGSGGSMGGITRFIRSVIPELKAVGVDTCKSVLFGQSDGSRTLRGLGNSIIPNNLDHQLFDYVSWVPGGIAFKATRELHRVHGLYMGGTSGASYLVAKWLASRYPSAKVVAIFPDEGHRYTDTIFNDDWLINIPFGNEPLPKEPIVLQHPRDDEENWTLLEWNKRTIDDVLRLRYEESV